MRCSRAADFSGEGRFMAFDGVKGGVLAGLLGIVTDWAADFKVPNRRMDGGL